LRDAIIGIRELQFWDFDSTHEEHPGKILKRGVQLMSTQLAMRNIQLSIVPVDTVETEVVKTKPLLYCLLCLFSYIEDNDFDHHNLNLTLHSKSVEIEIEPITTQDSVVINKKRNLHLDKELITKFAKLHGMELSFSQNNINLSWQ
jgi:hypothetical protein